MADAPFAVIMNGYTATLKTYTARRIANVLKIPLIETNRFGRCTDNQGLLDDTLRDKRYKIAVEQAALLAARKLPVVIDGTFNFSRWRSDLYAELAKRGVKDIIIVRCVCEDEGIITARLEERQRRKILPENEAARMENYLKTRKDNEPVYNDLLPSEGQPTVVEFTTGPDYAVKVEQGEAELAHIIKDIIFRSIHTGTLNEQ